MTQSSDEARPDGLTLRLFGRFEALRDNQPLVGLHLRDGERLFAYLLLRSPEPVTTHEIARYFWPAEAQAHSGEDGPVGSFPSVRRALSSLRSALGVDADLLTRSQRGLIQLDTSQIVVDLLEFNRLARIDIQNDGGHAAKQAAALYRGPLLAEWTEPWAVEARQGRQKRYELLLRQLALWARERGNATDEEQWARLLLAAQPGDEEMSRALLRLLSAAGRHSEALQIGETLRETLTAQKRIPALETMQAMEALQTLREPAITPFSTAPASSTNPDSEPTEVEIEPAGGAVPVGSRFYVERSKDFLFHAALGRGDSIVLVKGARQVGKTSLLARGLQQARQNGANVVLTDLQKLDATQLASAEAFYTALASRMARRLNIPFSPSDMEDGDASPSQRMEEFLLFRVLPQFSGSLIWAIDEADRLFHYPFGSEVFGLFRSWHNERALDPGSDFCRLTLAISYATDAQLFITDLNQSPFNVGTRLSLYDFTHSEIAELNTRYGKAALSSEALGDLSALVGGQPFLLRSGLNEIAQGMPLTDLLAEANSDEGVFGHHLRQLWAGLERSPDLLPVVRALLFGEGLPTLTEFYRLRASGILAGQTPKEATFRCHLYADFFARQFAATSD